MFGNLSIISWEMAKGQKNMEWAVETEVLTVGQDQGQKLW